MKQRDRVLKVVTRMSKASSNSVLIVLPEKVGRLAARTPTSVCPCVRSQGSPPVKGQPSLESRWVQFFSSLLRFCVLSSKKTRLASHTCMLLSVSLFVCFPRRLCSCHCLTDAKWSHVLIPPPSPFTTSTFIMSLNLPWSKHELLN